MNLSTINGSDKNKHVSALRGAKIDPVAQRKEDLNPFRSNFQLAFPFERFLNEISVGIITLDDLDEVIDYVLRDDKFAGRADLVEKTVSELAKRVMLSQANQGVLDTLRQEAQATTLVDA